MVGIYKILSPSGNVYIGQSRDVFKRWRRYKDINSAQRQPSVLRSFNKYGIQNHSFSVLHDLPIDVSQNTLDQYEIFYIEVFKECGFILLNIKDGGLFGSHGQETRRKIGLSKLGNKNRLGKAHTDATKQKISKSKAGRSIAPNKGKKASEETRKKQSAARMGKTPWNKGLIGHTIMSEENRNKTRDRVIKYWKDAKLNGVVVHLSGERCPQSKLTNERVEQIIQMIYEDKKSLAEIGGLFGISKSIISGIKSGKNWKGVCPETREHLSRFKLSYKFSGRHQVIKHCYGVKEQVEKQSA